MELPQKITFLNIPCHSTQVIMDYPPPGILSMAACLKKAGYGVEYIDADVLRQLPDQVIQLFHASQPDVLGMTLNVTQVKHSIRYIEAIKTAFPELPIILGGPFVTSVRERIFANYPTIKYAG